MRSPTSSRMAATRALSIGSLSTGVFPAWSLSMRDLLGSHWRRGVAGIWGISGDRGPMRLVGEIVRWGRAGVQLERVSPLEPPRERLFAVEMDDHPADQLLLDEDRVPGVGVGHVRRGLQNG